MFSSTFSRYQQGWCVIYNVFPYQPPCSQLPMVTANCDPYIPLGLWLPMLPWCHHHLPSLFPQMPEGFNQMETQYGVTSMSSSLSRILWALKSADPEVFNYVKCLYNKRQILLLRLPPKARWFLSCVPWSIKEWKLIENFQSSVEISQTCLIATAECGGVRCYFSSLLFSSLLFSSLLFSSLLFSSLLFSSLLFSSLLFSSLLSSLLSSPLLSSPLLSSPLLSSPLLSSPLLSSPLLSSPLIVFILNIIIISFLCVCRIRQYYKM